MYALVKIIKNPFEEEKDIDITLNEEKCICEIEGFDPNNSVSYVNGKHVTNDYKLKDGDVCVIRQFPEGITTTAITVGMLLKASAIALGALAVGEVISYAVSGRGLFTNIGIGLRKWLTPDTDGATNQEQITTLPSLSGSKNQSALGKAIPLILGKTLFAPYVIGKDYCTIGGTDGEEQFYHKLMLIGYKDLKIEDVSLGLEVLAENKTNPVDNGALTITSEKFPTSTYQTQLELQQNGAEVSIYPCKVVQQNYQAQLKNVNGDALSVYCFSARYPKKTEVELTFGGLIGYNDSGSKIDARADVIVEYSIDGKDTWINCSENIDLTDATGSSAFVPAVNANTVTVSSNISYEPRPYHDAYIVNGLSISLQSATTKVVKLQYYTSTSIRSGSWTTALQIPVGGTSASISSTFELASIANWRIVIEEKSYPTFALSSGTDSETINLESQEAYIKFQNQKSKTLRYVLRQEFNKDDMDACPSKVVSYRLRRKNAESTDTKVIDKVYLSAIRTWCYDVEKTEKWAEEHPSDNTLIDQIPMEELKRDKTARLGFSIKVTEEVVNYFDQINLIATSKARTWDSTNKKWSTTLSPTRNPVALSLHSMTGNFRDEPYRYKIDDTGSKPTCDKIDLDDFGAKYEICEQTKNFGTEDDPHEDKRYYCDGVVLNGTKSIDLANQILANARSCIVLNGKKYGIFMDKEQDYPLLVLNNNNLLSLSYSKNFDEIPDAQQVKYISAINYYQQDTIVVKSDPNLTITSNSKIESVEYPFITDPYHAKSMSLYKQACHILRPETFVAEVTNEGGLAEIGSLISIQSDRVLIGIGDGAEIIHLITEDDEIVGIQTDGKFIVTDTTKSYGVVINIVIADELGLGKTKTLKKKLSPFSQTGTYSDLYFETPISTDSAELPEEGCVLSFGFYENETLDTICIGKNEKGDGKYELTLVPYSPEIFEADSGMIADFDSKVTPPSESGMPISYGDKTVPATMQDVATLQGITAGLATSVSTLYSNHIVTLYKESTLPITETGITGTCTYNFATNGISWEGSNNGWSLAKPITDNPVYVTSATAFGKSATDDILPNEWAVPIQIGLNGTDGINTCTINLYKRLSTTPSNYPETLTYNFSTGSLVGEKNGWQTSIPDVDENDNAPCWEIHATALSTTTTDTIEASEWTSPAKITQDGYSKEEIMSWIEQVQIESPNIYISPSAGVFVTDDDGIIQTEQSITIDCKVIQTNEEIDFSFGAIQVPEGFTITASNHVLILTAQEGTRVSNAYFTIPIVFRRYEDNTYYVDMAENPYAYLNCQDGQWYGEINSVSNLPSQVNNNYFLWTGSDTTSTEEVVEGGVFKENVYYYSNGTHFKEATYVPYGMEILATSEETFNSTFAISTIAGGRYYESINAVANIPANPVIGDYFTWTGTDKTSASVVQGGLLLAGCVYKWNGVEWVKDLSSKHRSLAMKELMSVAENKLAQNNSDVIEYIRELITMNVVTENIQVTGEALIDSTITAKLTLGKQGDQTGYFRSWNYSNTNHTGFSLDTDGKAVLNEVTVRGAIFATSLTLDSGVNVPASKVDGLSDVATSGNYSDLDDTPNLSDVALSGDYGDLENKPALKTVATTGQYSDLLNPPDLSVYATKTALNEYAKLNQISTVTIGSQTTDAETGIKSRTVTIAGVGAGTFAVQESDDFMTFAHAKSDELTLLTSKPSDWSTSYKKYFRKDANGNYESLASLNSAPTWASNTYYSAENKRFYSVDKNGLLVASNAVVWGTIYATNGVFQGDVVANSFTLSQGSMIELGTNSGDNHYFGLQSDGTLTVRNINAVKAQIVGAIESENFDPTSTTEGYKFYTYYGQGHGVVPLLRTYQLESTKEKTPVFFYKGLAARQLSIVGSPRRYRDWGAIFAILGIEVSGSTHSLIVDGNLNGKHIHCLLIQHEPDGSFIYGQGYNGTTYNNIYELFDYGSTPRASVDIIF